jgi:hypothetical protein
MMMMMMMTGSIERFAERLVCWQSNYSRVGQLLHLIKGWWNGYYMYVHLGCCRPWKARQPGMMSEFGGCVWWLSNPQPGGARDPASPDDSRTRGLRAEAEKFPPHGWPEWLPAPSPSCLLPTCPTFLLHGMAVTAHNNLSHQQPAVPQRKRDLAQEYLSSA